MKIYRIANSDEYEEELVPDDFLQEDFSQYQDPLIKMVYPHAYQKPHPEMSIEQWVEYVLDNLTEVLLSKKGKGSGWEYHPALIKALSDGFEEADVSDPEFAYSIREFEEARPNFFSHPDFENSWLTYVQNIIKSIHNKEAQTRGLLNIHTAFKRLPDYVYDYPSVESFLGQRVQRTKGLYNVLSDYGQIVIDSYELEKQMDEESSGIPDPKDIADLIGGRLSQSEAFIIMEKMRKHNLHGFFKNVPDKYKK